MNMDKRYDFDLKTVANDWKDMVGKDWQIYKLKPVYTDSFVPVVYVDADERMASELVRRWNNFLALVEALEALVEHSNCLDVPAPFDAVFPYNEDTQSDELRSARDKARQLLQNLKA